jgi:hypothetical protein
LVLAEIYPEKSASVRKLWFSEAAQPLRPVDHSRVTVNPELTRQMIGGQESDAKVAEVVEGHGGVL